MNKNIAEYFAESRQFNELNTLLAENNSGKFHVQGMIGSLSACFVAAMFAHSNQNNLFILNDKEEAAFFYNDLQNLLPGKNIVFLTSSFKRNYSPDSYSNTLVQERIEALSAISQNDKNQLIISFPHAVGEKCASLQLINKESLAVSKNEKLDIDFLAEYLTEHGFEHTDFVYEAGQFSVRGGIVDVFSFANEFPYRIEFFGNEIESIREFNPETQLSTVMCENVKIIPNLQAINQNINYSTLFEFIPSNTIIWINDVEFCSEVISRDLSKIKALSHSVYDNDCLNDIIKTPDNYFTCKEIFLHQLQTFTVLECGSTTYFNSLATIKFEASPQPDFHKDFKLLVQNLRQNSENGLHNILCADSEKQKIRLQEIFQDIGKDLEYNLINLSIHKGFVIKELQLACYTDHQIFERYHKFHLRKSFSKKKIITLKELQDLNPGDYVTHIDHGIGKFAGLEKIEINGKIQEAVKIYYQNQDILYVNIHSLHRISKFTGSEATSPKLNKLGSGAWEKLKNNTKSKVKDIAKDLIALYAKRKAQKGFAFSGDTYMQSELEASFIYEDTPDQLKSTEDVKTDMESIIPMDRLICGDVGFGKTEVAIRAAFKAVADSKQVAILVPTTILALQHYHTFSSRLKEFPCKVDYLNRFKNIKDQKLTLKNITEGKVDIIIGTHRLVSKDVKFYDLGLLIIDEEQKFGVSVKEKLRKIRENVDTLTLTATPIPRTLHFSLMGARDLSVINTPPPNRQSIHTEVNVFNDEIISEAVQYEVSRGGQIFFIHNRVKDIEEVANVIQKICPKIKIGIGHAQMENKKLEQVMIDFIEGEYDVLICTTIVESGLDIPNANTMIINQAQNFGLSDLYQLRGRVGRSNRKAFCYLFTPPLPTLTPEARKRISAIEEFSDLGSGLNVALRDLDIRGAGNLLGGEQSGFIYEMGFEMYHKILDEAIAELKAEEFKGLFKEDAQKGFVNDCQIETDLPILIPETYVNNISQRLAIYNELNRKNKYEELEQFETNLCDRFGKIPVEVKELINSVRLKWLGKSLGFEKIILKNDQFIGVVTNENATYINSGAFSGILNYVHKNSIQNNMVVCHLKESKGKLIVKILNVPNVDSAIKILEKMNQKAGAEIL